MAKLQLNSDPNGDSPPFTIPKTDLTLEMEKLNIGVTSTQFQLIVGLLDDMNQFQLAVPYRKFRPYNQRKYLAAVNINISDLTRMNHHQCPINFVII